MIRVADRCLQAGLKACATGVIVASTLAASAATVDRARAPVATVSVIALRTEYKANPLGIDEKAPRLFWQIQADRRGVTQSAYEVHVAASQRDLQRKGALLWDSGRVTSDQSADVLYAGSPLASSRRYYWQ